MLPPARLRTASTWRLSNIRSHPRHALALSSARLVRQSISWWPISKNGEPIPRVSVLRAIPPAAIWQLGIGLIRRSHSCFA